MLYIGSDHRGYELKEKLKKRLSQDGVEISDVGNDHLDPQDDYVDFAHKVGDSVVANMDDRGVVLCGSGVGVDMVANKIDGVRCALVYDTARAVQSRQHEDVNVLALPADSLSEEQAYDMVKAFLETPFSGEPRHLRRLHKLEEIEEKHF
jgi:ribose 5-phosphate isomerase B